MNTILHSALLQRLSLALLHSTWQIVTIALILLLLRVWFRSPQARHALSMLALVGCIAWPVADLCSEGKGLPILPAAMAYEPATELPNARTAPMVAAPTPQQTWLRRNVPMEVRRLKSEPQRLLPWLGLLWCSGVVLLAMRQALMMQGLHRLRRTAIPVPSTVQTLFDQLRPQMGVTRAVQVVQSARAVVPMVIGSLRPIVVLPMSVLSGLPMDQVEALLAHELAHLRRWDELLNLLQCVIETLLFFHPAVWWIGRCAREDRELCCDDLATSRSVKRETLALALGQLALSRVNEPALAATGGMSVVARMKRLLQPEPRAVAMPAWPLVLVLVSGVGVAIMANAEAPARGRILDRHGVVLAKSPTAVTRKYPHGASAAHVLGYTGYLNPKREELSGKAGIEQAMDEALRAKKDVTLTLDLKLQQRAEALLATHATNGGAIVVVDAQNGDVLTLASGPSYDLNEFGPPIPEASYQTLLDDEGRPLMGRAFQGVYFPGSTFKLVTALAGLRSGTIDESTQFEASGSYKIGERTFHNWHSESEGMMGLTTAIKRSANTWFYQAALKMGSEPLTDTASLLGFGQLAGLPLPEQKGFLPTDAYYQQTSGHRILSGMLGSMSIGQVVTATPVQQAMAVAALGNGGKLFTPRLVTTQPEAHLRTDLTEHGVKPEHLALIRKGMIAVVQGEGGTGGNAMVPGIVVAGKTGTAQWIIHEDDQKNRWLAVFVGYAPAESPRIAFCIVYEGAPGEKVSGGKNCAPIAREIIEAALRQL